MVWLRWTLRTLRREILVLPTRTLVLAFFVFLAIYPLLGRNDYQLRVVIMASIHALYAASWDLLAGFTGQVSFGHSLFFGVAAYATALLNLHLDWSPLTTIPMGALAAVLAGLLLGLPALRLKGPYLGLATLAFPVMLTGIVFVFPQVTGGELGVSGIDRLFRSRLALYYVVVSVCMGSVVALWKITGSRLGIILHAIREDEIAVRAAGLNTTFYKLAAFALSGLFAGLAGGLYAHVLRVAGPSTLDLFTSFQPIIYTIFGSIATIYGPVVGVFVIYPLVEALQELPQVRNLVFALLLILAMRFMPQGLSRWVRDRLERECPRCKVQNAFTREACRVCGAPLRRAERAGAAPAAGGLTTGR